MPCGRCDEPSSTHGSPGRPWARPGPRGCRTNDPQSGTPGAGRAGGNSAWHHRLSHHWDTHPHTRGPGCFRASFLSATWEKAGDGSDTHVEHLALTLGGHTGSEPAEGRSLFQINVLKMTTMKPTVYEEGNLDCPGWTLDRSGRYDFHEAPGAGFRCQGGGPRAGSRQGGTTPWAAPGGEGSGNASRGSVSA